MKIQPDKLLEKASKESVKHISRRGFLSLFGKSAIGLVMGGLVEVLLPVDRSVETVHASHECSDWKNCGMHGYPCACCGGSSITCPSGTSQGSYWTACCHNRLITYYDCCGSGNCSSCPWCANSNSPNWCGSVGGDYVCTLALVGPYCP
jgi:methylamine dehydrogenase light chain